MKKSLFTILCVFFAHVLFAQENIDVSGFVQDSETRQGISKVSIFSTKLDRALGTTNNSGYFKVTVPNDDVLIFSSVDFNTVRDDLSKRKVHVFTLYMDKKQKVIDEVVVQGYTSRSRETLTGSSVRIDGKDLQENPVSNVLEMLQGKVPGMNIQVNSGQPGARTSVMVRGISNLSMSGAGADGFLTPTSPLYVVDGVQVDDNTDFEYGFESGGTGISPISLIPPEDIESIDVLKDAAATALYGSRGAYGVIIITTKRGQSKVPIIQYTTNQFFNTIPKLRDVLGGVDERYARINQVMNYHDGDIWSARDAVQDNALMSDSLNPYYNNSTNWQGVFYKPTYNQTHNLSASGGDVTFNYKINGSYFDEKGIIQNTGFKRYTLNMNSEYRPTERFRLSGIMSGNFGNRKTGSGNSVTQGGVASASSASSLLPAPSASFVDGDIISALEGRNDDRTTDLRATLDLDVEVLRGLRASNSFSYNYKSDRKDLFTPAIANNNISKSYNYDAQRANLYNLTRLNYIKDIDRHMLLAYVFSELTMTDFMAKAQEKTGFPNDQVEGPFGFNAGNAKGGVLNNMSNLRSAGFAGALSFNLFDKKYIFDFNYRFDKSSAVGPDVPWIRNPAISARWNIEKENFMEAFHDDWLDYFSLRSSWGKNIVPTGTVFDANGRFIYSGYFNNDQTIGFSWGQMPNTRLIPSTTTQSGVALELGLFENRINATAEYYYKQTDNMLWEKPLTSHNAFTNIKTNEVSNVNYGYEFSLLFRPLAPEHEVKWDISLNGAWNRDILTMLPDQNREFMVYDEQDKFHTLYRLGRNSMSFVLFDYRGTFATEADVPVNPATGEPYKNQDGRHYQAGDPYWTDLSGDYIFNDEDLVVVGNAQPNWVGGLNTNVRYKGFTLNTQLSYTYRRDVINAALAGQLNSYNNPFGNYGGRKESALLPLNKYDFWTRAGDVSALPNPYDYTRNEVIRPFRPNQTLFMEDGSYLKINYVTLGYNIPRELTEQYGVTSTRLYFTANNIHTFSKYSGPNPELVTTAGYDRTDGYPTARSFTLGLSVQF